MFSSSPIDSRYSSSRPICASVWSSIAAKASWKRAETRWSPAEKLVPGEHVVVSGGELGAGRDDPHLQLSLVDLLPFYIPPPVEPPAVLRQPLRRRLQRGVAGAERQVEEERLVGHERALVADHGDALVHQILAQVVVLALRARPGMVVLRQHGLKVVGEGIEEPVVALEALLQRPVVEGPDRGRLSDRGLVPLADREGAVPVGLQHLRQSRRRGRDRASSAGEARVPVRIVAHPDRVVVPPGQQARPGSGADRRHVEVRVAHARLGEPVHVWGLDRRPVAAQVGEARRRPAR